MVHGAKTIKKPPTTPCMILVVWSATQIAYTAILLPLFKKGREREHVGQKHENFKDSKRWFGEDQDRDNIVEKGEIQTNYSCEDFKQHKQCQRAPWARKQAIVCPEFNGEMNATERTVARHRLRASEADLPVMLIMTKAGGAGLNLDSASVVIRAEPWWVDTDMLAIYKCYSLQCYDWHNL